MHEPLACNASKSTAASCLESIPQGGSELAQTGMLCAPRKGMNVVDRQAKLAIIASSA